MLSLYPFMIRLLVFSSSGRVRFFTRAQGSYERSILQPSCRQQTLSLQDRLVVSDCPAVEHNFIMILPHGRGALCVAIGQSHSDTQDRADEVTLTLKRRSKRHYLSRKWGLQGQSHCYCEPQRLAEISRS